MGRKKHFLQFLYVCIPGSRAGILHLSTKAENKRTDSSTGRGDGQIGRYHAKRIRRKGAGPAQSKKKQRGGKTSILSYASDRKDKYHRRNKGMYVEQKGIAGPESKLKGRKSCGAVVIENTHRTNW